MKVTYDDSVDCGYVYFDEPKPASVKHTIEVKVAEPGVFGQLNVDIGHDGRVVGIEILGVSTIMPDGGKALKEEASDMTEDICRFCGTRVGYGIPEMHVGVCDKPACQAKAKKRGKRRAKRYTKARAR